MLAKDSSVSSEERWTFLSGNFQINLIVYINPECCNQAAFVGGFCNPLYQVASTQSTDHVFYMTMAFSVIILTLKLRIVTKRILIGSAGKRPDPAM